MVGEDLAQDTDESHIFVQELVWGYRLHGLEGIVAHGKILVIYR